jgi:hypothetical protein
MKQKVLAIGGGSVPRWVQSAFDVQHVSDEEGKGKFVAEADPDVIVVNVDFVSHQYSWQAHELGAKLSVPVLHARGGWSTAVEEASRLRLDWFVDAVGAQAKDDLDEPAKIVKSAWSHATDYERQRADAATKRLGKETKRRAEIEAVLRRVRSGAQDRVLSEINRRVAELRAEQRERHDALKTKIAQLTRSMLTALSAVDSVKAELSDTLAELEGVAEEVLRQEATFGSPDQVDSGEPPRQE